MFLKSSEMNLSSAERHWLPWFGKTGKIAMRWACFLNRKTYPAIEKTFEGIASTRLRILTQWTNAQWEHLAGLAEVLAESFPVVETSVLQEKKRRAPDMSEIFVIDRQGRVIASTHADHLGARDLSPAAISEGLKKPFLHGPYVDPLTLSIGPSSSKFHDEVTLMFYQPILQNNVAVGCVCGRVPNDVIGDLIQREAGHIFRESGDNYIFMVDSRFDPSIQPGTALSRSRFEDHTFSLGDNLKQGVRTAFGTVQVSRHTELELRFTDPATGQLHPGVRETIANRENLFVTYPGYSDYRHIPVIGKGITFRLPGSRDTWGMMCEADLEEVYRRRSLNYRLLRLYLATVLGLCGVGVALSQLTPLVPSMIYALTGGLAVLGGIGFYALGSNRLAARIVEMTEVIRTIAEGGGNLRQRLDVERLAHDETGDLGRYINSFIDNLDGTVAQVIQASANVGEASDAMLEKTKSTIQTSGLALDAIDGMLVSLESQMREIQNASATAEEMRCAMDAVAANTRSQFDAVRGKTQVIRDTIDQSARAIQALNQKVEEITKIVDVITEIAGQTNLLALNAAIEAARAGHHGRGFSVVAEEVRKLAERTTDATKDIRKMIEDVQAGARSAVSIMENSTQGVEEGLQLAEEAASDNKGVHNIVERLLGIIHDVAHSSRQHAEGARRVAGVTQEMKQSVEALQDSADLSKMAASRLRMLMGQFQVSGSFTNDPGMTSLEGVLRGYAGKPLNLAGRRHVSVGSRA